MKLGLTSFKIACSELSPILLARAADRIKCEGLESHFQLLELDLNRDTIPGTYTGAMVHHALHHVIGLEHLFDQLKSCLKPSSKLIVADVIGRNGHMLWPEALRLVRSLWATLPTARKYNQQWRKDVPEFENWDCSKEGFEGIRAQDILTLMLDRFYFERFLAYGNLVNVFINRSYGHNYDPTLESDRAFIDFLQMLDEALIDCGYLKPTHMLAVVSTKKTMEPCVTYKHWTPEFCWRDPNL
jgi:SAM-dependent methyltransferase